MKHLLASALLVFLSAPAQADLGPKPQALFRLGARDGLEVSSLRLYRCEKADCADAQELTRAGPQHFGCCENGAACSSLAYGFGAHSQLRGKVAGRELKSNVFSARQLQNEFELSVGKNGMEVRSPAKAFSEEEKNRLGACR